MSRSCRASTDGLVERLQLGQAVLEDFLSEGEFLDAMLAARWRMIRTFADARSAPGKGATPGYIVGLDNQLRFVLINPVSLHKQNTGR